MQQLQHLYVTTIHMTATTVWYDMTNDSDKLMTLTVLTQWDMWIDEASWVEVNKLRLTRDSWAAVSKWTRWMMSSVTAELMWWAEMMSSVDDVTEIACVWWHGYGNTSILYYKSKLVLLLRLGYLKHFLAGSKKTRQGPGCRVGALHISRCWFYLMVVVGPKIIHKDYKIIWCCVLLCYGSWCLWYVNDEVENVYEMIMQ